MDCKLRDTLYYRFFRLLFKRYLEEYHGDCVRAFYEALVESSKAEITNEKALMQWIEKRAGKHKRLEGEANVVA
jgi:hypothetical protein